jgi:hypothetical protein
MDRTQNVTSVVGAPGGFCQVDGSEVERLRGGRTCGTLELRRTTVKYVIGLHQIVDFFMSD